MVTLFVTILLLSPWVLSKFGRLWTPKSVDAALGGVKSSQKPSNGPKELPGCSGKGNAVTALYSISRGENSGRREGDATVETTRTPTV
jgi:hypothetical protein